MLGDTSDMLGTLRKNKCAKFRDYRSNTLPQATAEPLPLLGMLADDVTMEVYT
ncbi:hypothetical protein DPMN_130089 [Dreissena polymorpha]|uniref:Uncharacterized protein n=1 Tax=Dreissena polymorpha TaxID=45954 RepID=A0A9D4HAC0_DREPO|nr:hypothetical protein DPMN_130089 [Dreissena polymorpha]